MLLLFCVLQVQGNNELQNLYRSHSRGLLKNTDGTWCFWAPEMCRCVPFQSNFALLDIGYRRIPAASSRTIKVH